MIDTAEGLTTDAITKHNVKVVPAATVLLNFKLTVGRISITTTDMCSNEAMAGAHTKCIPNYPRRTDIGTQNEKHCSSNIPDLISK